MVKNNYKAEHVIIISNNPVGSDNIHKELVGKPNLYNQITKIPKITMEEIIRKNR